MTNTQVVGHIFSNMTLTTRLSSYQSSSILNIVAHAAAIIVQGRQYCQRQQTKTTQGSMLGRVFRPR